MDNEYSHHGVSKLMSSIKVPSNVESELLGVADSDRPAMNRLGAGHDAVEDRGSLAAIVATHEQVILAADCHGADHPLTEIVVDAECSTTLHVFHLITQRIGTFQYDSTRKTVNAAFYLAHLAFALAAHARHLPLDPGALVTLQGKSPTGVPLLRPS